MSTSRPAKIQNTHSAPSYRPQEIYFMSVTLFIKEDVVLQVFHTIDNIDVNLLVFNHFLERLLVVL